MENEKGGEDLKNATENKENETNNDD